MSGKHALSILAGIVAWAMAAWAAAAPGLINYQGRLTDASGQPVTTAVNVTFTFWDAPTGGSFLGGFLDTDTVTPDANGLYATLIGDDPDALVPASVFEGAEVWLNVNVQGEDLQPRKRIVAVPYALHSDRATTAAFAQSGTPGPHGPKGEKGDTGTTGPQGLKGDIGTTGPQGLQGPKGEKGDTGTTGSQGLVGAKGDTGTTGSQGLKGDTGTTGPQGLQGVKGDTGATGPQGVEGPQGPKGDPGDPATTATHAMTADQASTATVAHRLAGHVESGPVNLLDDLQVEIDDDGNLVFSVNGTQYTLTPTTTPTTEPIEMVSVPAGTFVMGKCGRGDDVSGLADESPTHTVTLSAHRIGKYEVTNGEYCDILNWALGRGDLENSVGGAYAGGDVYTSDSILLKVSSAYCLVEYTSPTFTWETRTGSGGADFSMERHPVVEVSWFGSVAFCNWLSEREGLTPAYDLSTWELIDTDGATTGIQFTNGYRLLTEAEWERAAAWDISVPKHWIYGMMSDTLTGDNRCNYGDVNPLGLTSYPYTSPVGWFDGVNVSPNGSVQTVDSPSPVGSYDMTGNVWEWCHDWYLSSYYSGGAMTNPTGPSGGPGRVMRGGSCGSALYCRSAQRSATAATGTDPWIGFRLARSE